MTGRELPANWDKEQQGNLLNGFSLTVSKFLRARYKEKSVFEYKERRGGNGSGEIAPRIIGDLPCMVTDPSAIPLSLPRLIDLL